MIIEVLPPERYQRAVRYVCYERHFYYLYSGSFGFTSFPLVHLDRFLGWKADPDGPEPLLPSHNGFALFLDTYVRQQVRVWPARLEPFLRELFDLGHQAAVSIWWAPHDDGVAAVTSALLEGMDEHGIVGFTKVNQTRNQLRAPMEVAELATKLALEDDGTTELTVIKDAAVVRELARISPRQAFGRLFHDFYGFETSATGLLRYGSEVVPEVAGLNDWLAYLEASERRFLVSGSVPKPQQFRLSQAVRNCFTPGQYFLEHVLTTPTLAARLSPTGLCDAQKALVAIDSALLDLQKYTSLLVQRPQSAVYSRYLRAFEHLRDLQPAYQQANLRILRALARPNSKGDDDDCQRSRELAGTALLGASA